MNEVNCDKAFDRCFLCYLWVCRFVRTDALVAAIAGTYASADMAGHAA